MALFMRKLIDSSSKVLLKSSAKCSGRQLLFSVSWVCQRKDQHTGQEGTAKSLIWRLTHLRDSLNVTPHTDAHSKVLTESETLYELQFHYVKPECMQEYQAEVSEMLPKMHENKKFPGELIGSWTAQYGELDQAVHLWSYEGGYHCVSDCKHFLATDKEFLEFAKRRAKLLRHRNNELLHEFHFWGEPKPREPSHIYELRSYQLKPGTLIEWGNNWGKAIKIRQQDAVGGFFSQIGSLYRVHHIWAYTDLPQRKEAREIMWQEPGWGDCVANTVPLVNEMESRILIPASFSPLQ